MDDIVSFSELKIEFYEADNPSNPQWIFKPIWRSTVHFPVPLFSEMTPAVWEREGKYWCGVSFSPGGSVALFHGFAFDTCEDAKSEADYFANLVRDKLLNRTPEGDLEMEALNELYRKRIGGATEH